MNATYGYAKDTVIRDITFHGVRGKAQEKNLIKQKPGLEYGRISFIDFSVDGSM